MLLPCSLLLAASHCGLQKEEGQEGIPEDETPLASQEEASLGAASRPNTAFQARRYLLVF